MDKLSAKQIEEFIELGYVKIENAFSKDIADSCRAILWEAVQLSPDKPETWTQPVIRIGELGSEPFKQAANTPILLNAFNQLAFDNWLPRLTIGTFPLDFQAKKFLMTPDGMWMPASLGTTQMIILNGKLIVIVKAGLCSCCFCFPILQN